MGQAAPRPRLSAGRIMAEEIMDDPGQSEADFSAALDDLERLNRLSLAHRPLLAEAARLSAAAPGRTLSVLDVGAGGGDALRALAGWGARRGVALDLWGLDRSPWAERHAAARGTPARWITADLFDLAAGRRFDLVCCALFTHHLDEATLARFLAWLPRHAARSWLVSDLHRHWLPWAAVWAGTRVLRMHPMVTHDGPVSVGRAFVRADWDRALAQAGVVAEVRWAFPFRWLVRGEGTAA